MPLVTLDTTDVTTTPSPINYKAIISEFIVQWEKFANAYFWTPPQSAPSRRNYEKYHSRSIDLIIGGFKIEATINVDCSCRNIYVNRTLKINGEVKRITALKNILKTL